MGWPKITDIIFSFVRILNFKIFHHSIAPAASSFQYRALIVHRILPVPPRMGPEKFATSLIFLGLIPFKFSRSGIQHWISRLPLLECECSWGFHSAVNIFPLLPTVLLTSQIPRLGCNPLPSIKPAFFASPSVSSQPERPSEFNWTAAYHCMLHERVSPVQSEACSQSNLP
jgi:hypothetical protein